MSNPESSAVNPYNNFFGQQGWICPKCGRVYSPFTTMCPYCKNEGSIVSNLSDRCNEPVDERKLKEERKQEPMTQTIKKAAVKCAEKMDKKFEYHNTELPYVVAIEAFNDGAEHVMSLPLLDRLTPAEKERVMELRDDYYDKWLNGQNEWLEAIFGKELFEKE